MHKDAWPTMRHPDTPTPGSARAAESGAALADFVAALDAWRPEGDVVERCFALLCSRERLARLLAASPPSHADTQTLVGCDARLRENAAAIASAVGPRTWRDWRESLQPAPTSWWWSLDQIAAAAAPPPHPLWAIAAGAFITLAATLGTDISLRFLSGGPDLLGLLSTFSQAILAVLAGGAFTRVGSERVDRLLSHWQIAKRSQGAWKTLFALGVLVIVVGLWLALPWIARGYNDRGALLQQAGKITQARQSFERALKLSPDFAAARYNLANALEETLEHDAAMGEYHRAIKLDQRLYPAYNNLARLYLLRKNDAASALALIDRALALEAVAPEVRYSLLKNRGWANWRLDFLLQAQGDLEQALALRPQGAAAFCLLAQVLEAQKEDAAAAWQSCVAFAPGQQAELEPGWIGRAQERLLQGR